mmetsp:Transcript_28153/g.69622  ORF Transcript_28153/g.69622 Transcript_28153/m.69622 type:complete len:205 (+) Transcript_28153:352-966(+)
MLRFRERTTKGAGVWPGWSSMYSETAPASMLFETNTRILRSTLPSLLSCTTVFCSLDTLLRTCSRTPSVLSGVSLRSSPSAMAVTKSWTMNRAVSPSPGMSGAVAVLLLRLISPALPLLYVLPIGSTRLSWAMARALFTLPELFLALRPLAPRAGWACSVDSALITRSLADARCACCRSCSPAADSCWPASWELRIRSSSGPER